MRERNFMSSHSADIHSRMTIAKRSSSHFTSFDLHPLPFLLFFLLSFCPLPTTSIIVDRPVVSVPARSHGCFVSLTHPGLTETDFPVDFFVLFGGYNAVYRSPGGEVISETVFGDIYVSVGKHSNVIQNILHC